VDKYDRSVADLVEGGVNPCPRFASPWWKDLLGLEAGEGNQWFNTEVTRKVGNGNSTSFWEVAWRGDIPFRVKYPRLFSLSNQREAKVGDLCGTLDSVMDWVFSWRCPFFVWEDRILEELLVDLGGFMRLDVPDRWWWKLEEKGSFSVSSMYRKLDEMVVTVSSTEVQLSAFTHIWKSPAPSKVIAFSWKLLRDRILTRVNLSRRHVLPLDSALSCVLCKGVPEVSDHLFLNCVTATAVWTKLLSWLGFTYHPPPDLFYHWKWRDELSRNKKIRKAYQIIWHAAIWTIWRIRNDFIFNNSPFGIDEMVEDIEVLVCRWVLSRLNLPVCLFYEWMWNPQACLVR